MYKQHTLTQQLIKVAHVCLRSGQPGNIVRLTMFEGIQNPSMILDYITGMKLSICKNKVVQSRYEFESDSYKNGQLNRRTNRLLLRKRSLSKPFPVLKIDRFSNMKWAAEY